MSATAPLLRLGLHAAFGDGTRLRRSVRLKRHVHRVFVEWNGRERSVVAKRLEHGAAKRNEFVARHWLPVVDMEANGPGLLASAAEPGGEWIWQIYEDFGEALLETRPPDRSRVQAAVRTIARLHASFADHPVLAECRLHGATIGMAYAAAAVRDAIHGLRALRPPRVALPAEQAALRRRLLERLGGLLDSLPERARVLEAFGGPDTLLHGDLWTTNTLVMPNAGGWHVRLIDWDRAGVGPACYDLSAFLLRFPPEHRSWVLDLYRRSMGRRGWNVPGARELNTLFETVEMARYASRLSWPALALLRERATWAFEELAEIERWFRALEPVLPDVTPLAGTPGGARRGGRPRARAARRSRRGCSAGARS